MRRNTLSLLIKLMFGLMFLVVVVVLFRYAGGAREPALLFDEVLPGQTKLLRLEGSRVWVTRLNLAHRQQYPVLAKEVQSPDTGCNLLHELCILSADSDREGIVIRYLQDRPIALSDDIAWAGGFVDPASGTVYDLFGRAYQPPVNETGAASLTVIPAP